LIPGVQHTLSFEHWGDGVTFPYSFFYEINGMTTAIAAIHSGLNSGNFHTELFTFTPIGATTTLRFAETSTTTASPIIDNVAINSSAVPEPASIFILGTGVISILAFHRCRRSGRERPVMA
jgi:hypothetical protein